MPLPIGSLLPSFDLMGTHGVVHGSNEWKGSPILVIAFHCNHCPESQLYEARLNKLTEDFAGKGVSVVAIQSSNPHAFSGADLAWSDVGESLVDMKERATFRKFCFPYLYDCDTGSTALGFGATVAPSIFIFDTERKLRYSGRIDNNPADGSSTKHEAAAAIDALLAGNPIAQPMTTAAGCPLRLDTEEPVDQKGDDGPVNVSLATAEALSYGRLSHAEVLRVPGWVALKSKELGGLGGLGKWGGRSASNSDPVRLCSL